MLFFSILKFICPSIVNFRRSGGCVLPRSTSNKQSLNNIHTRKEKKNPKKYIYIWRKRTINSFYDEFEIPPIISTLSPAFGRHRRRVFCVHRRAYTIYSKKKLNILFSFEKNKNKNVCIAKEIIVWTSHTRLFILFAHNFLVCAT